MTPLLLYFFFINILVYILMAWDKNQARNGGRRFPERNFFLLAVLGGSLGAILGMYSFHHKTRHWYFVWGMPAILLAQILLVLLFFHFGGQLAPFDWSQVPAPTAVPIH